MLLYMNGEMVNYGIPNEIAVSLIESVEVILLSHKSNPNI